MDCLLTSLLEYSTISIQKPCEKTINTQKIVHDVIVGFKDTIEQKKAVIECASSLPDLRMNNLHLTQLFQNLISNSLKFTEQRPVVKITCEINGKELFFTVKDNGIGIDEEFHNDVFRIFKRLNSEKTFGEGSGAGLTFVKKIVENHGGRIWIESEPGSGTTFYFTLKGKAA